MADTKAKEAAPTTIDPSQWVLNTERATPKRVRESGIDRTPFYSMIKALKVGQVVEIPNPLTDKEAKSVQNIVRESAKDLNFAVTFLVDVERNAANGKRPEGTNHYAWFVKGPFVARGPRPTTAK